MLTTWSVEQMTLTAAFARSLSTLLMHMPGDSRGAVIVTVKRADMLPAIADSATAGSTTAQKAMEAIRIVSCQAEEATGPSSQVGTGQYVMVSTRSCVVGSAELPA